MLKKLIKNEYIATARFMIPLYIVLAVLTVMNKIILMIEDNSQLEEVLGENIVYNFVSGLLLVTYILSIFAVFALTVIFIIKRFYDNMLKDEAYLSFTLPVTTKQHLYSKVVVSYTWIVVSSVVVMASLFVMGAGEGVTEEVNTVVKGLRQLLEEGYGPEILAGVVLVLIGIYNLILLPYTCFSIGQRMNGHPVIGAFVTYIVIYMINQIIGIITLVVVFAGNIDGLEQKNDG